MYLILCGSSMSFMESQVLGKESPLYGRRTGQFKIEPLDYKETAVFHQNLSAEDNYLIYGITGGVPHYINKLDVRDSVDEALLDNFFRFWYRFVPINMSAIDSGRIAKIYLHAVKQYLTDYMVWFLRRCVRIICFIILTISLLN